MSLKFRHAGQACITANRVYIQRGVYDKFADLMVQHVKQLHVGHGLDPKTTMGPLTVPASVEKIARQVEDATKHGAMVLFGGSKIDHLGGYYFEPTIIKDASPEMLVTCEETFGPLLALYPFDTEEEVVEKANNTSVCLPQPSLISIRFLY
jgi:acyl-CoA reductase-like NAD-dependent aldehyde dehydrogenase